jgi:hypothetical protein
MYDDDDLASNQRIRNVPANQEEAARDAVPVRCVLFGT